MNRTLRWLFSAVLLGYFFCTLGVPIFFLVKQAFLIQGVNSLDNFRVLFSDDLLIESFLNSFSIAVWACILSIVVALLVANFTARRQWRGRAFLDICILAPLFLPPMVGVLGIKALLSRSGSINLLLQHLGLIHTPIDFISPASPLGVIAVQTIHLYPLVYFQLISSLSRINGELEEAAVSVGASPRRVFINVTLPLLAPALISSALLVFIASFTDIGTPLLFEYRNAVPVRVFNMLTDTANSGSGFALVFIVGCISFLLFVLARWFEQDVRVENSARSFVPIAKKPQRSAVDYLWMAACIIIAVVSFAPHLGVMLQALAGRWFMTVLPERYTAAHFVEVFFHPVASKSLLYSIILSFFSTLIVCIVGFFVAWGNVRRRSRFDRLLEYLAMLPLSLPGIVIAFGLMLGFSGTILDNRVNPTGLLILAYSIRRLPFMVRILVSGLRQSSSSLEEAAYVSGATWKQAMFKITLPLISPSLIAGSILCFVGGLLEVSDSLLLALEEKFYPVAKALYALQGRPDGAPVASALSVVVTIVVITGFYGAAKLSHRKISQLIVQ